MLVMGDASMHKIPEIKRSVELSETKVMMIPGGLTRYLQPLDVSINKPFKEEIRRKYNEYCIENTNLKVSRKQIIDWVGEIWYSEKLSSAMISKSFKKAGVTLNFDGSEDELFIGYSKEDDVEEMVGEVDQTPNDENNEPVEIEIEIVKEEVDNPSDDNYSIILAESDDEEEEKEGTVEKEDTVEKDFPILKFDKEESELIENLQEELDDAIFPKRVRDSDLHKFYEIRYQKK